MAKDVKSYNPFLDDDEVDDFEFLSHPRQGNSGYLLGGSGKEQNEYEAKRMQLLQEKRKIEERTLQSTNKSLGLLHESEQVGILTAEELLKQREQLHNIEDNLDNINSTMRVSQKHINSIKSIFGGIKSFFNKDSASNTVVKPSAEANRKPPSYLQGTVGELKTDNKEIDDSCSRFPTNDLTLDDSFSSTATKEKIRSPTGSLRYPVDVEEKIEQNIDDLSLGLGRLKNLAIGLNEEIEQQNDMIDSIHNKADKVDETIEYQNRQIKRLLKK